MLTGFAPFYHECDISDAHDPTIFGEFANGIVGDSAGSFRLRVRQLPWDKMTGILDMAIASNVVFSWRD